ncbi:MAG: dihydropteroate synthase [Chloroflexi bacterium]|nr:dihydropteroate synthase [Chloroflexota bacterium]MBU1746298.1 dihydropteroate synthase [Chloroflexota bacterium]MBU1878912.1 dihydropteroate synthase [Chloroflexota bacterium]
MKIIGEKINGTRSRVKKAVAERDAAWIQDLARRQAQAGADWLDVNAGTPPDREPDDLAWLVQTVQEVTDVPLCLDSANAHALAAALPRVQRPPLINSISGEQQRLQDTLPLARAHGCPVIALALDDRGIPGDVAGRLAVVRRVVEQTRQAGLADDQVYVDPLVMALATNTASGQVALDTMRAICAEFPAAHLTSGLSNVSFGLPARSLINQAFLALALAAGLDTAIIDPLDQDLRAMLLAAELVLGRDRHCRSYIRAYRAGRLGRHSQAGQNDQK